jgi:hypothetical protein
VAVPGGLPGSELSLGVEVRGLLGWTGLSEGKNVHRRRLTVKDDPGAMPAESCLSPPETHLSGVGRSRSSRLLRWPMVGPGTGLVECGPSSSEVPFFSIVVLLHCLGVIVPSVSDPEDSAVGGEPAPSTNIESFGRTLSSAHASSDSHDILRTRYMLRNPAYRPRPAG